MKRIGVYIHIPFCIQKCHYCDFNSYSDIFNIAESYVLALTKEMQLYVGKINDVEIDTVFIGGGTPTCLETSLLERILINLFNLFKIKEDCEISIEANPGTLTREKLYMLRNKGVNRLSMGLQSWNDEQLKRLGRLHSSDEFVDQYYIAKQEGFDNINIDLMFSLPDQTLDQWKDTLDNVIGLSPEHISTYGLKIEKGTRFYDEYQKGILQMPDEDLDRDMYEMTMQKLIKAYYIHYEISNFARKGYECRHNLKYWTAREYIGMGAGSHSYIDGVRYSNEISPIEYIKKTNKNLIPIVDKIDLTLEDRMSEYMFLGLRLMNGLSRHDFYERFGSTLEAIYGEKLKRLISLSLIEKQDDTYLLTKRGIDISNQVFMEFI